MADDPNPALRAKLTADRDALVRQVLGLVDLGKVSISVELIAAINEQLTLRVRRDGLLKAALDDLDAIVASLDTLTADGWPAPVSLGSLNGDLFGELQGQKTDLESAISVFQAEQMAAKIAVKLGDPVSKT